MSQLRRSGRSNNMWTSYVAMEGLCIARHGHPHCTTNQYRENKVKAPKNMIVISTATAFVHYKAVSPFLKK